MWIKKTTVKTQKGNYTYIQLVQSTSVKGKSRHKVIANLGRMDQLDMETVEALVASVSSGTYDSLKMEEISLLPVKRYGGVLLLKYLFEETGIRRLLVDIANYKNLDLSTVDAVFALVAYYSTNHDEAMRFNDWLKEVHVPNSENVNKQSIRASATLLNDTSIICESLASVINTEGSLKYNYVNLCLNKNIKNIPENVVVSALTTEDMTPVNFKILKFPAFNQYDIFSDSDVTICDNSEILKVCRNFEANTIRYIYKLKKEEAPIFFQDAGRIGDFVSSGGYFTVHGDIGYKSQIFEGKQIIVIRPTGGYVEGHLQSAREPRDVLVTNLDFGAQKILDLYFHMEKIQNYFYTIYLPVDLDYLYAQMSNDLLCHMILNIYFLSFLFSDMIEKRAAPLGLSTEDVFNELDDIVSAKISNGVTTRHFHSRLTERHIEILSRMGLSPHPTVKI